MFGKYKITKDQEVLVEMLSEDTSFSKKEIVRFFVEMGMAFVISWQKGKASESLVLCQQRLTDNPELNMISKKMEAFYNAGE